MWSAYINSRPLDLLEYMLKFFVQPGILNGWGKILKVKEQ